MANIFFQISRFCLLTLFVEFGLCAPPEYLVKLLYGGKYYIAKGSLTDGQWNTNKNGGPSPIVGQMALVVLSLCEPFKVSPDNEISIGFDGKFTGTEVKVPQNGNSDDSNVSIIPCPVGDIAPSEQFFDKLKANAANTPKNELVTFPLTEIHTQNLGDGKVNIVCGITIGINRTLSPDITLVSNDDKKVKLLGYRMKSAVRFVGANAEKFQENAISVKSWFDKSDKSEDDYDYNDYAMAMAMKPVKLIPFLKQTIGGQLIVDANLAK